LGPGVAATLVDTLTRTPVGVMTRLTAPHPRPGRGMVAAAPASALPGGARRTQRCDGVADARDVPEPTLALIDPRRATLPPSLAVPPQHVGVCFPELGESGEIDGVGAQMGRWVGG